MTQRQVFFVIYDGFELLDMSGPAAVFSTVGTVTGSEHYRCRYVSVSGGTVVSGCGLPLITETISEVKIGSHDTVLIMGADEEPLLKAVQDAALLRHMIEVSDRVERIGSVCTGAFLLAVAGLLNGRSAATHWIGVERLALMFPEVKVLPDAMYHIDGHVWTSAGVTTGVDMALAMIETDLGAALMERVAKRLVVYSHRPGNQSQFSHVLDAQMASARQFSNVVEWMEANLDQPIRVEDMAERAGMSERTFYRKFTDTTGVTPSKFLETMRLEFAKQLIGSGKAINQVATASGFKSQAGFRAAFEGKYGVTPSHYRRMNCR